MQFDDKVSNSRLLSLHWRETFRGLLTSDVMIKFSSKGLFRTRFPTQPAGRLAGERQESRNQGTGPGVKERGQQRQRQGTPRRPGGRGGSIL